MFDTIVGSILIGMSVVVCLVVPFLAQREGKRQAIAEAKKRHPSAQQIVEGIVAETATRKEWLVSDSYADYVEGYPDGGKHRGAPERMPIVIEWDNVYEGKHRG